MEGNNGRASVAVVIPCFNDGATLMEAVADYVFPLEADDLVAHGALGG
jgi:hypothetical protein